MDRMLLVLNPCAGQRQANRVLPELVGLFTQHGYRVEVLTTSRPAEATEYVARFGGEVDRIVCVGGDGTFNEVVSGLLQGGHKTPIGYIPAGSTNDFANSLHLKTDLLAAAHDCVHGKPHVLDVGSFGGRYFAYIASFGAFTRVSYATSQNAKNALGHLAYILEGIRDLPAIRPIHLRLEVDGKPYEGDYIFGAISNTTSIGGVLTLDEAIVDMNDGVFEVMLVDYPTTPAQLQSILLALTNHNYDGSLFTFLQARHIVIYSDVNLVWALDGEQAQGQPQLEIENLHDAITLMLPCDPASHKKLHGSKQSSDHSAL